MIRQLCACALAGMLVLVAGACGSDDLEEGAGGTKRVKLGYLHTVAVDENLWVGEAREAWKDAGVEFEALQFNTGVALGQALASGEVDVGIMGSVLSNFPSRGQGKVFLANNIEAKSVKFYGNENVKSIADLEGKRVTTTTGAAGHVVLHEALQSKGLSIDDVDVVNADMPTAVNAYLSGSAPALVTWLPFNVEIGEKDPTAKPFASGDEFYGPNEGLLGGWVASNQFHAEHSEVLEDIASAWLEVNKFVRNNPAKVVNILHKEAYKDVRPKVIGQMHRAAQLYSNDKWARMYEDGTVADLIGQTEKSFVAIGAFDDFVNPDEFFDPQIFLEAYNN